MSRSSDTATDRSFPPILLFTATLFVSASLMFVLQPMFGKILLPLLGGSPAAWNTCMVFYQSILFLGYLYAHGISTRQTWQRQILIHGAVILFSFLALPLALPTNTVPPTGSNPTLWLLRTLFFAIGMPFFVVSTIAPLMQKWFANIGHCTSHDPYFLYAAGNAGSMIALLGYPFVLEPHIGLAEQKTYWSAGYLFLCVLTGACAFMLWRTRQPAALPADNAVDDPEPGVGRKLHWLALSFVPSSLLLGLTNFISTDIAAVPLLWIIPLTLYLLSFVIVFSKWRHKIHPFMVALQPVVLMPFIVFSFINPGSPPYWLNLGLHLLAFFIAAMVCHGELATMRPHTRHLTDFYLILSFAGMLGGMFNTFVAPFIFNAVYEYPIMILAALLLRPGLKLSIGQSIKGWLRQNALPVILIEAGAISFAAIDNLPQYFDAISFGLILLTGLIYCYRAKPVTLALLTGAIIFFAQALQGLQSNTLYQERTFFGVLSVRKFILTDEQIYPAKYHVLIHGVTLHGAQSLADNLMRTPLTYYSRPGPMGQLFKAYDGSNPNWTIGIVGLGAGALACYAKDPQNWIFYEIDPLVVEIAETPAYFSYLKLCKPDSAMRVGDARLSLETEPDQKFDLLVIDAFSSDSVPTHLLTQEALRLYFKKLKTSGILAFHITNRHLALKKVLSDHARQLRYSALLQEFKPEQGSLQAVAADWVIMANQPETLEPLLSNDPRNWQKLPPYFDMKPWTDDFTNIISIWK
jgi:hypothetical protein